MAVHQRDVHAHHPIQKAWPASHPAKRHGRFSCLASMTKAQGQAVAFRALPDRTHQFEKAPRSGALSHFAAAGSKGVRDFAVMAAFLLPKNVRTDRPQSILRGNNCIQYIGLCIHEPPRLVAGDAFHGLGCRRIIVRPYLQANRRPCETFCDHPRAGEATSFAEALTLSARFANVLRHFRGSPRGTGSPFSWRNRSRA